MPQTWLNRRARGPGDRTGHDAHDLV